MITPCTMGEWLVIPPTMSCHGYVILMKTLMTINACVMYSGGEYLLESTASVAVLAAVKAATILFTVVPGPAGRPYSHVIIVCSMPQKLSNVDNLPQYL